MRRYETTFIVNPQADDAAIDRQVGAVTDLIKADGGKILNEHRMGTRRLAYPIGGLVQGFYATILFDAESTVLPRLERLYKLEEPYVRYLTIRYEGKVPEEAAAAPEAEAKAPAEDKPKAETTEVKAEDKPVEEAPAETKPAEEAPAETKPAEEAPAETRPVEETPAEPKPTEAAEPPADRPDPADEEL